MRASPVRPLLVPVCTCAPGPCGCGGADASWARSTAEKTVMVHAPLRKKTLCTAPIVTTKGNRMRPSPGVDTLYPLTPSLCPISRLKADQMKRKTIEHYEIERRLGAGGSGVVYLANDTLLQRPVVLKILRAGLISAHQLRSTILREARLASAIEHPNVCAIYDVGESSEGGYIVMQYVPGQSLDQLIARGPASLQLVLSVGIQVADGLQAAHALGIFHRDLKPQNVMLTDGGLA